MQIPDTIPMMLGQGNDDTIKVILSEPDNHLQNILRLSKVCKVKVKFTRPFTIYANRRHVIKDVSEYTFNGFFQHGNDLCYLFKGNGRHGQYLPMQLIESYEPVLTSVNIFNSLEEFKKKFDTFFITDELIEQLYTEKSAQTGAKYCPSDFKPVSTAGKEALRQFLMNFKGVSNTDRNDYREYTGSSGNIYYTCNGSYYGRGGSTSRDIRISHQFGFNRVSYSSEFHGCGNGRYGILATRSTYLWLEDD
jgi:hypothetical protein